MQVRLHEEGEKEKDGEVQVEVESEDEEIKENRTSWMVCGWSDRHVNDLSQEDHDTSSGRQETQLTARCCAHSCISRAS